MKTERIESTYRFLQTFYLFAFFAFGALFPLLSVYLEKEGLNHTQIGIIISIIPIVTIFVQPVWGMISDYTRNPRLLLTIALVMASVLGILYTTFHLFFLLFIGIIGVAIFQSAIVPLSDSISLNFVQTNNKHYGNIRLFGSIGFAVAVFIVGKITDATDSLNWIFYIFALGLILALFTIRSFPKQGQEVSPSFRTGLMVLIKKKKFLLFLLSNFLIFGPVLANNYYFSTFILTVGGTLTGVGFAFLLAAGSEAPFMTLAQKVIDKVGVLPVLIFCSSVSAARWIFYFTNPDVGLVYATTIIQGISVGLYIPAALLFVREVAPKDVRATAVGIYSAVGNGMGNAFFTFVGGIILDKFDVFVLYGFFSLLTIIGILITIYVFFLLKKEERVVHLG